MAEPFRGLVNLPPGVAEGNLTLWYGDRDVGEGLIRIQPGKLALGGAREAAAMLARE